MTTTPGEPRVGIAVPTQYGHFRRMATGFALECRRRGLRPRLIEAGDVTTIEGGDVAALAIALADERLARVRSLGIPLVNVSAVRPAPDLPSVLPDNRAIGRMAAEHLLDMGHRRFAWLGIDPFQYSRDREEGFAEVIRARGLVRSSYGNDGAETRRATSDWIRSLERPLALFACNDRKAAQCLAAAVDAGLEIPGDIAVLGVDDEDLFCEFGEVPLSSIDIDGALIGSTAAALIARLLHGEPAPASPVLVPPRRVVVRQSTDALIHCDPATARAIRFIRSHAHEGIDVEDVLREVPLSRRSLERAVRATLGRSPAQEIIRCRLRRACGMLEDPALTIAEVARRSGFSAARQFAASFRQRVGMTPGTWRAQRRIGATD